MAFKLVAISALLAVANAGFIGSPISYAAPAAAYHEPAPIAYAAPVAKVATPAIAVTKTIDADYDSNPQYSFAYNVQDSVTGDSKEQEETRNGDSVQGRYSLIEADGSRRIVEYTADPINGFNAVVHKEPAQVAVKAVAAAPAVAYAAPVVKTVATAPAVAYAAPVVKAVAAAPALAYAAPPPLAYSAHAAPLAYGAPAQSHLKIIH